MPQRALPKPPKLPKLPRVEEPPQLSSPPKVELPPKPDRSDQKLGLRPKVDRGLRDQPSGPFISPYMHHLKMDPSHQRREDTEQLEQIRELREKRREINEEIRELRNQDTRINPYNVNRHVEETADQMISDLRNMGQSRWSGNLSGFREYAPLYNVFKDQFSIAEEDESSEEPSSGTPSGYYGYSPLHNTFRDQFGVSEEEE